MHSRLFDELNFTGPPNPYEGRNQCLFWVAVFSVLFILRIRAHFGDRDHGEPAA
jgi:hypothetical protein